MSSIGLVPIILIVVILILSYRMVKRKNQKSTIVIGRNTHFNLLAFFLAVLFVATIFTEVFYSKINSATPPKEVGNDYNEYYSIEDEIYNRRAIDPDLILENRTHPAGKTLTIQWGHDPYHGYSPVVYIERKQSGDQTIEEFIYKPLFIVDEYDFSNSLDIAKPVWTENKMTFPKKPVSDTTIATFFYDAALLQQLTKNRQFQPDGYSFSENRVLIIHLKIPADLKIVDTNEDFLFFVD
ncbi:hypothetical protein JSQ81_14800 [Sporosarcina sp. Marseille-Q4063]|uniref:hypothetical protein n=1 Tax=Sporosarcina sp. Marseille-Q4063 TaxID=2810514 RepID=UPI001BAFED96|nr:hypothetical protein [Sporosarcina sp. Marseille-Q4063]QUW21071.1 hypothetical protein JSQ81_14800 [Sporosarcina sp. Marseille-Q4063]